MPTRVTQRMYAASGEVLAASARVEEALRQVVGGSSRPRSRVVLGRHMTCFVLRKGCPSRGLHLSCRAGTDRLRSRDAWALVTYPMITQPGMEPTWGEVHVGPVRSSRTPGSRSPAAPRTGGPSCGSTSRPGATPGDRRHRRDHAVGVYPPAEGATARQGGVVSGRRARSRPSGTRLPAPRTSRADVGPSAAARPAGPFRG